MLYIYIHSFGEIVEKLVLDSVDFCRLEDLYKTYRKKYKDDQFCFDVMIL